MSMPSEVQSFVARYGDGRSAASRLVEVFVGIEGLELVEADGSGRRIWPYKSLTTATPVTRRATDVLISFAPSPAPGDDARDGSEAGATLFVDDRQFVSRLTLCAPYLRAGNQRRRYVVPGLVVSGLVLLAAAIVWLGNLSPSRAVASVVPSAAWSSVGESVFHSITADKPTCSTEAGKQALDRMIAKLSQAAGTSKSFDVRVVDWPLLNAFALPGRRIVLTRLLVETVGSADELAGVVAHEMGHGLEMHPETSIVRVLGLSTALKFVVAGGGDMIANAGLLLVQLSYTRDAEREADAHAVGILRNAKVPAKALATFFQRLDRTSGHRKSSGTKTSNILSTHPSTAERIRTIEQTPNYPTEPVLTSAEFEALRAICRK